MIHTLSKPLQMLDPSYNYLLSIITVSYINNYPSDPTQLSVIQNNYVLYQQPPTTICYYTNNITSCFANLHGNSDLFSDDVHLPVSLVFVPLSAFSFGLSQVLDKP